MLSETMLSALNYHEIRVTLIKHLNSLRKDQNPKRKEVHRDKMAEA